MIPGIDRVYVNDRARAELGWQPRHDFRALIARLKVDDDIRSPLAREVGGKGYYDRIFGDGPYPVEGGFQRGGRIRTNALNIAHTASPRSDQTLVQSRAAF